MAGNQYLAIYWDNSVIKKGATAVSESNAPWGTGYGID